MAGAGRKSGDSHFPGSREKILGKMERNEGRLSVPPPQHHLAQPALLLAIPHSAPTNFSQQPALCSPETVAWGKHRDCCPPTPSECYQCIVLVSNSGEVMLLQQGRNSVSPLMQKQCSFKWCKISAPSMVQNQCSFNGAEAVLLQVVQNQCSFNGAEAALLQQKLCLGVWIWIFSCISNIWPNSPHSGQGSNGS